MTGSVGDPGTSGGACGSGITGYPSGTIKTCTDHRFLEPGIGKVALSRASRGGVPGGGGGRFGGGITKLTGAIGTTPSASNSNPRCHHRDGPGMTPPGPARTAGAARVSAPADFRKALREPEERE